MKFATIAAAVVGGFFLLRYLNREISWQAFWQSIKQAKAPAETVQ